MKTAELTDILLDWAVSKCQGYSLTTDGISNLVEKSGRLMILGLTTCAGKPCGYNPTQRWDQGGPIIELHGVAMRKHEKSGKWYAKLSSDLGLGEGALWTKEKLGERYGPLSYQVHRVQCRFTGATALEAAMRCYVASKLGLEIDIPKELL